jgi:integrase
MIAIAGNPIRKACACRRNDKFLTMLPAIREQAQFAFRNVPVEAREEQVQEVVATAYGMFNTLASRGKINLAYATPLAKFAIWLGNIVSGLATTGVRISELAALRWNDVSDDLQIIQIVDERHRRPRAGAEVRTTKTGRSRAFPIHADLRRVLETVPQSADGRIFHGPRGGRLKADVVRRGLIRDVLEKLKGRFPTQPGEIGFINGRLHSFRHFFCSRSAQSGVPEHVVMSWLGHSSSTMVRHYFHLHDEESQRQMQRMNFLGDAGRSVAAGDGS